MKGVSLPRLKILVLACLAFSYALANDITVWTSFQEPEFSWLAVEASEFEAIFDVSIDIVPLELGEIKKQMLVGGEAEDAADIILPIPHDQIVEMAEEGVLLDLSRFTTAAYLADLAKPARQAFTLSGGLHGLPLFVDGPALIVNRSFVERPPDSYESFLQTALANTEGERYGFLFDITNLYFAYAVIRGAGGYVFGFDEQGDVDPSDVGLATDAAVQGVMRLRELAHEHELVPPGIDYRAAHELFKQGKVAMTLNGPWAVPEYLEAGIDLMVLPLPNGAQDSVNAGFMAGYGVLASAFSERKSTVANLAKWLTRAEAQARLAAVSGRIPAAPEAAAKLPPESPERGFAEALHLAEPVPSVPEMGLVWGPIGAALQELLHDAEADTASVLAQAVARIRGD